MSGPDSAIFHGHFPSAERLRLKKNEEEERGSTILGRVETSEVVSLNDVRFFDRNRQRERKNPLSNELDIASWLLSLDFSCCFFSHFRLRGISSGILWETKQADASPFSAPYCGLWYRCSLDLFDCQTGWRPSSDRKWFLFVEFNTPRPGSLSGGRISGSGQCRYERRRLTRSLLYFFSICSPETGRSLWEVLQFLY